MTRVEIHVVCRITDSMDERAERAALDLLSADERARHDRFWFPRDRRDYAAAHALLRTTLSAYSGEPPASWRFETAAGGKPFVVQPCRRLSFNLSHARGLVACAVAEELDLGVDVERIERPVDVQGVADRFFSTRERAALAALAEGDLRARFFELWTLKEAYLKATGAGLTHPLHSVSFDLEADGMLRFAPPAEVDADRWQFALFEPTPQHRLAVAAPRRGRPRPVRAYLVDDERRRELQPARASPADP